MKLRLILSSLVLAPLLNLIHPISITLSQEEIGPALIEADLLTSLAGDYANIGQKNQAIQLLKEPLSLNQSLVEPCHRLMLLASVAGQYAFMGQKVKSSEIFTQARSILEANKYCGSEPSGSSRSDPTAWIAAASSTRALIGQYDTAFQIATGLGDQYLEDIQDNMQSVMSYSNILDNPELIKLDIAIQRRLADFYFRTKEVNKARKIWLVLADYYKKIGESEQATQFQNLASKIEPTEDHSLSNQSLEEKTQRTLVECFMKSELLRPDATWATTSDLGPRELKPLLDLCKEEKLTGRNIGVTDEVVQVFEQISVPARRIPTPIKRAAELAAIANIYGSLKKDVEATQLLEEAPA
uniref:hypothetical protein n=1 Tax=Trichocoleus desertorum TaxID=1481672 RepID=UPI0025B53C1D|nr:hypothetical protein [Trichocoleus desertorum]